MGDPRPERRWDLALSALRWTLLGSMLLITLMWPYPNRTGLYVWTLVLALMGYNLLVEIVRRVVPRLHAFTWFPVTDLVVAALLYGFAGEPAGSLFVGFFLAVITASVVWPFPAALGFTLAVVAVIIPVAVALPGWSSEPVVLRLFATRVVLLAIVAVITAEMARRLRQQVQVATGLRADFAQLSEWSELYASAAHNLRTHLTALQASLGLIEDATDDRLRPEEQELLANARRNAARIRVELDDLLTAGQMQSGILQLDRVSFDVREVVDSAIQIVGRAMRTKAQTLAVDLPAPMRIEGDARRLEQVVVNLLENAHVHGHDGVRIAVTGRVAEKEMCLTVSDDGPGIPAAAGERIFERFYQGDHERGTGLGLAIARNIVILHGGRMWAENRDEGGASFTFCVPLAAEPPAS